MGALVEEYGDALGRYGRMPAFSGCFGPRARVLAHEPRVTPPLSNRHVVKTCSIRTASVRALGSNDEAA